MQISETKIPGVYIIESKIFKDNRGTFVKIFNKDIFKEFGLNTDFAESFYSKSIKGVIRGMHIQLPPMDHSKVVYVSEGKALDVVLDIRVGSPTYKQFIVTELSPEKGNAIYMPSGCVHGFLALENNTCTVYLQSATHSKDHDTGIKFDSFGVDWGIENPIISDRDLSFQNLEDFQSPFIFKG